MTQQSKWRPDTVMVLAAGLGTRMRPLTNAMPKPLVPLVGRALIDHVLDRMADNGVTRAIINVHYMAEAMKFHLAQCTSPAVIISDESDALLETGGGVVRAAPLFNADAILIHNSDSVWYEPANVNLPRLFAAWDGDRMDTLMLLAPVSNSLGYSGRGDFHCDADGRLSRSGSGSGSGAAAPYVFAGVSILNTAVLAKAPPGPFSLNVLWDHAIQNGRLFGVVMDGTWMHVGDPQSLAEAEVAMRTLTAAVD